MKTMIVIFTVTLLIAIQISLGEIPKTISYQGILTNPSGDPVPDNNYNLTFRIYDAATIGSILWTETHSSVAVVNGVFNVILGSAGSPLNLAFDNPYWLSITVGLTELTPRVPLTSAAYSLNSRSVADGSVTSAKIPSGQVVKSLNNLRDNVTIAPGTNVSITPSGNTLTIAAPSDDAWKLTGNTGTNPNANFLGTIGNQALEFRVNNARILRLEPNATSPNIVGGFNGNSVTSGVIGAVITGGGKSGDLNLVTDYYGTIGGGADNQAGNDDGDINNAYYNTIGGGHNNKAIGQFAFIGGGQSNEASDLYTTVGGGGGNKALGGSATVGGGQNNEATGFATVSGGSGNKASGGYSTIGGGEINKASSLHSTVSGDATTRQAAHTPQLAVVDITRQVPAMLQSAEAVHLFPVTHPLLTV